MSDQLLDQIADRPAMQSDKDFVDGILDDIFKKFQNISDLKIKLTTDSSFQAASKTVADVKKNQDELSLSVQQYSKILDQTAINQAKLSAANSDQAKALAASKVALASQNQELIATAKLQQTSNNSVGEAIALVNKLKIARNAISIVDEESKQRVADLNQQIDLNNKFINENTSKIEQQKNNVGNYVGAISILKDALAEVNAKIEENTKSGQGNSDQQAQLIKEQQLLTSAVGRQAEGFSSLAIELRVNQQLLATMAQSGLSGTKAFEELREKVNEAQKEFNEFREQQKLLASETGTFEAVLKGAEGLVGIYGAAVSASKLFGDNTEELEKSMQKLEAVIALLNSLQAINRTLHEGEAIAVTLETAARKGLNTVMAAYTYITEGATVATQALRAALVATGIGAIVVLLGSFISSLKKATEGVNEAREAQQKYNETLKDYYDQLSKNNDITLEYSNNNKQQLQDQLELLTAQGASYLDIQAIKRAIAQEDQKNSAESLKNIGAANSGLDDQKEAVDDARKTVESLKDEYVRLGDELTAYEKIREDAAKKAADAGEDPDKDRGVIRANSFIKSLNASREALLSQIEPAQKLIETYDKATQAISVNAEETKKYNDEQNANLKLNTDKTRLNAFISANAAIVADTRKTEQDRVEAIRQGAIQQAALEQANLTRANATPGLSDQQKIINAQNTAAAILKIDVEARKSESNLVRQYDDADYAAQTEILKAEQNDRIANAQAILDDDKTSYSERQKAASDAYSARRRIATAELFLELNDRTTTDNERKEAQAKFDSDVLNATIAFNKQKQEIDSSNRQKLIEQGVAAGERNLALIKSQYDDQLVLLNNLRANDLISEQKYQKQRAELDAKYAQQELQVEIQNAYFKVNSTKEGTTERAKAEQDLSDLVAKLSDNQVHAVEDAEKRKQKAVLDTIDKIQSAYDQITDILGKALDAQVTAQKNAIQLQINGIKDQEDAQIQAINNTVASETDKAAKIAIVQAQAQAQTEALQRRQKELDIQKAEFDKIKSIGTIILKTAEAVVTDLENPGKIAFDIAVGAAELAIAVAAPIPTYALGVDDHPGGPAILGDGGRSEMAVLPDGSLYISPAYDTLVPDLPAHTIVHPDARKFLSELPENVLYSTGGRQPNNLERVFLQGMNQVAKAIQEKEELHINPNFSSIMAIHKYGNSWVQWVNENIQF